ncbi:hypothetical protein TruAng_011668 [Truncatella angustata]|nr:hypothetical protein TruAng_011668 [Truncatella angustata]
MSLPDYISFENLDVPHREAFSLAINNILSTDLALTTYAQIIDGLPTSDVAWDQYSSKLHRRHPINDHVALCSGVLEKAKEFRADLDLEALRFSPTLLQAYQSASTSSQAFGFRLIELTAAALHQIGVFLFHLELRMHNSATTRGLDIEAVTLWEPEQNHFMRIIPDPTLFTQSHFTAQEQYPDGLADIAGYWAEDRILGGVVLFDRSQSWAENSEPNIFQSMM